MDFCPPPPPLRKDPQLALERGSRGLRLIREEGRAIPGNIILLLPEHEQIGPDRCSLYHRIKRAHSGVLHTRMSHFMNCRIATPHEAVSRAG